MRSIVFMLITVISILAKAQLILNPSPIDGNIPLTSSQSYIYITNNQSHEVTSSFTVDSNVNEISIKSNRCSIIKARSSCYLIVSFPNHGKNISPVSIVLRNNGIQVSLLKFNATVIENPSIFLESSVTMNDFNNYRITIQNKTFTTKSYSPIFTGVDASKYTIVLNRCSNIVSGAKCFVFIKLKSQQAGNYSAFLNEPQVSGSISLSSTIIGSTPRSIPTPNPSITVSPNSIDFGIITQLGQSASRTLTITNNGNIGISPIVSVSGIGLKISINRCLILLSPGQSCAVSTYFDALSSMSNGVKSGLFISAKATATLTPISVPVLVSLDSPSLSYLSAFPVSLDFGTISTLGKTLAQNVVITNNGSSPVIPNVALQGRGIKILENNCKDTMVAAGGSCLISVYFQAIGSMLNGPQSKLSILAKTTPSSSPIVVPVSANLNLEKRLIITWRDKTPGQKKKLPVKRGYNYDFTIDWGDGLSSIFRAFPLRFEDLDFSHVYEIPGDYTISITGLFEAISMEDIDASQIISVTSLGDVGLKDLSNAFAGAVNLVSFDIGGGNTSLVTNMSNMFSGVTLPSLDLSNLDTSSVTNMSGMFSSLRGFGGGGGGSSCRWFCGGGGGGFSFPNWNTSSVTNMSGMFQGFNGANLNLSNWDTSSVTDMSNMFSGTPNLTNLNLGNWNTSSVTNMSGMFRGFGGTLLELQHFITSSVTDMSNMFSNSNLTDLNLSNWDTSSVTNMRRMFRDAIKLRNLNLSNWDMSFVNDMSEMFLNDIRLGNLNLGNWNINTGRTVTDGMFIGTDPGIHLDLPWYIEEPNPFISKWRTTSDLESITLLMNVEANYHFVVDWGDGTTSTITTSPTDYDSLIGNPYFSHTYAVAGDHIVSITGTYEAIFSAASPQGTNPFNLNNYEAIFANSQKLIEVTSLGDVGLVNLNRAFYNCQNLTSFNVGDWGISSKVTNMSFMFTNSSVSSLDLSFLNTASVKTMSGMFSESSVTSLDLSWFDTSSVTDMSDMFYSAYGLTSLDLSWFNTSSVSNMSHMFNNMELESLDVSWFNTSSVTDMRHMFGSSKIKSLDLSGFNVSSVKNMIGMFAFTTNLTNLNLSNWNSSLIESIDVMFLFTPSLIEINATNSVYGEAFSMNNIFELSNPNLVIRDKVGGKNFMNTGVITVP